MVPLQASVIFYILIATYILTIEIQRKGFSNIFLKLYLNEILRTWESQQTFSIAFLPVGHGNCGSCFCLFDFCKHLRSMFTSASHLSAKLINRKQFLVFFLTLKYPNRRKFVNINMYLYIILSADHKGFFRNYK